MTDIIFGLDFGLLETPDNRFIIDAMKASNVRVSVLFQACWLRNFTIDKQLFPSAITARSRIIRFVNKILRKRLQKPNTGQADIFAQMIDAKDPETGTRLSKAELGAESTTLMFAGTETTAAALSALFHNFSDNPQALTTATAEIRAAFPKSIPICMGPQLHSCRFLKACIDETLRLNPPIGSAPWRKIVPGGAVIDGESIPAGCDVGTAIYAIQRSEKHFKLASEFRPERWLDERGDNDFSVCNPFSIGTRSCVGKGLALREIVLVASYILQSLDIRAVNTLDAGSSRFLSEDHITTATTGPFLAFRNKRTEAQMT